MTREEFEKMVRRVEERTAGKPAILRWRAALLAAAGYGGFITLFAAVVALDAVFFA